MKCGICGEEKEPAKIQASPDKIVGIIHPDGNTCLCDDCFRRECAFFIHGTSG